MLPHCFCSSHVYTQALLSEAGTFFWSPYQVMTCNERLIKCSFDPSTSIQDLGRHKIVQAVFRNSTMDTLHYYYGLQGVFGCKTDYGTALKKYKYLYFQVAK